MCCALSDPASFPVRLLSAATRRFAAGLLSRSDPPIRRRSDCLSVSSPGCRLLSGTLHSGAFQFLVPKKRASVAPGPSRTGKGAAAAYRRLRPIGGNGPSAAMVLRRLRLFGGCGPAVIALRSAPCIFSFGRGRSVTAGREYRLLSEEYGCVRPHDRFCAAGAKKEVRCLPASSLSG